MKAGSNTVTGTGIKPMIIICSYCKSVIGKKEPLENLDFTYSLCDKCWDGIIDEQLVEKKKLEQIKKNKERRDKSIW